MVIGDFRDLSKESAKLVQGQDYSKFLLLVSALGLALEASTILSLGTTLPAKVSVSMIKAAKKTQTISKQFSNYLVSVMSKMVNVQSLKKLDFTSPTQVKQFYQSIDFSKDKPLFDKLNNIRSNVGNQNSIKLLKYVNNEQDLQKLSKNAKKYKKNTPKVYKVLAEASMIIGQGIWYFLSFIEKIIGLIASLASFCFLFVVKRIFRK